MAQTILITGASSGIGRATVLYFAKKGWNVAATMRKPEKTEELKSSGSLKQYRLDVENKESIKQAVNEAIHDFGRIDVLLNNAGYGAVGPLEYASLEQIRKQFEVNVFGLIQTTRTVLPHFRTNRSGRIINISSMGGRMTFPLYSLYHSTKFAVEGLSESLNYELNPLGIDVKLVEPGAVRTEFTARSMDFFEGDITEYKPMVENLKKLLENLTDRMIPNVPEDIARVIYKASTTTSKKLRFVAGNDAKMLLLMRKMLGVNLVMTIARKRFNL